MAEPEFEWRPERGAWYEALPAKLKSCGRWGLLGRADDYDA
jgi:hypothetical protein